MTQSDQVAVDAANPCWHLARSLSERLAAGAPAGPVDEELGGRRLARWKAEPVFVGGDELFGLWLDSAGVDEDTLAKVLGEAPETVRARFDAPPAFVRTIERTWNTPPAPAGEIHDHDHDHAHDPHAHADFVELVRPLIDDGVHRVREAVTAACAQNPSPHIEPRRLADQLAVPPLGALNMLIGRVLVLELNVLRVQGQLAGDTPQERFADFVRRLRDRKYALDVLMEDPVLARDATVLIDNWVNARVEFAERLVADAGALAARLSDAAGTDPGTVTEVSIGAGDSHRGGRSVGFVHFADGSRVVYKPRGLSVESHFQELLTWLNDRGATPSFRTLWV
ncbi:MAG TPA: DUF4135 domain-containing protein, partial [Phytomonospora sp.]